MKIRVKVVMFSFSKEVLHRSEAIGRLAAQISEMHEWASMDAGQIKDQLLNKQAPSFSGKKETVSCINAYFFTDPGLFLRWMLNTGVL